MGESILPSDYISIEWCQFSIAQDIDNNTINFTSKKAVAWLALGAVNKLLLENKELHYNYCNELRQIISGSINSWNDANIRTKNEIIGTLKQVEYNLGLNIRTKNEIINALKHVKRNLKLNNSK